LTWQVFITFLHHFSVLLDVFSVDDLPQYTAAISAGTVVVCISWERLFVVIPLDAAGYSALDTLLER
jgi:hypothetical protein